MTNSVADFSSILRDAIAESRSVVRPEIVDDFQATVFACYTTSSEWLGETGEAITSFINQNESVLPASCIAKLNSCLKEIGKVWPKFNR